MDGYLSELIDYLDLYKVLLDNNCYDSSKEKDAENLINLIDDLKERVEKGKDLSNYDYSKLRKKVAVLFHPDYFKYKLPDGLNMDAMQLIQKFNGTLDFVVEGKNKNSFNYNEAEPFSTSYSRRYEDYTKNDYFYDNKQFNHRPMSEELERERRREARQDKMDDFINNIKNGFVRTKDYVCVVAKERFDALFRAIPSNVNDYYNIKRRFENTLNNLSNRENIIASTLDILYSNREDLDNNFNFDTSNLMINNYYKEELNNSINNLRNMEAKLKQSSINYKMILNKYAPLYNQLMQQWVHSTSEIFTDIINANNELHDKTLYEPNEKEVKNIKRRIGRLNKERENYPTVEEARLMVIEHLKNTYPEYQKITDSFFETKSDYENAYKKYDYISKHEIEIKDNKYYSLCDVYREKRNALDNKINKIENKHVNITNKIYDTRVRYGEFLDKYESIYETYEDYKEENASFAR
jgi:hypothetical protein